MTALVIGARGFLGSALCRELARRQIPLRGTIRRGHSHVEGSPFPVYRVELAKASQRVLRHILRDVDTVYHLAWSTIPQSAAANPTIDLYDNVVGTVNLLEALRSRPEIRLVFASSGGAVYGPPRQLPLDEEHPTMPISAYGMSKLTAENYLAFYAGQYGVNSVSLRIGNAYGTNQDLSKGLGAVTAFTHAVMEARPITVYGDGTIVRDYVWVDDVVEALIAAGSRREVTGPVNIGSGVGTSLLAILSELEARLRVRPQIIWREPRRFDVHSSQLDIRRAEKTLAWKPRVDLRGGISHLCDSFAAALPLRAAQ